MASPVGDPVNTPEHQPGTSTRVIAIIVAIVVVAAVLLVGVLLAGRDSGDMAATPTSSSSAPTIPSPTPTPASVVWAGQVCTDIARVQASVSGLGSNLNYDVTADASALEQIQRQLTVQVLAVGDAIDKLNTTLTGVPVDAAEAADFASKLGTSGGDTQEAIAAARDHLSAAAEAEDVLTAFAEVGQALVAGKAAYEAGSTFVSLLGDATSSATGQLQESFDAAPQCRGVGQ